MILCVNKSQLNTNVDYKNYYYEDVKSKKIYLIKFPKTLINYFI